MDFTFVTLDGIQYLVNFASYFIFSFMGSLLKEIYNTNNDSDHEFEPYRVVTSTIIATLVALAIKEYYKETLDQYWGIMGIISLILGFVGFELFYHISSIKALKKFIKSIKDDKELPDEPEVEESKPQKIRPTPHNAQQRLIEYHIQKPILHHPNEDKEDTDKK